MRSKWSGCRDLSMTTIHVEFWKRTDDGRIPRDQTWKTGGQAADSSAALHFAGMGKTDFFRCHFRSPALKLRHLWQVTRGHDKPIPDRDKRNPTETCKRKYGTIIGNHRSRSNQVQKTVPGNDNRPQRFEPLKTTG